MLNNSEASYATISPKDFSISYRYFQNDKQNVMLNDTEASHATISPRDSSLRYRYFQNDKQNVMLNDSEASHASERVTLIPNHTSNQLFVSL